MKLITKYGIVLSTSDGLMLGIHTGTVLGIHHGMALGTVTGLTWHGWDTQSQSMAWCWVQKRA
eukprot:7525139-Ditylum_brightwellii.AAC.1